MNTGILKYKLFFVVLLSTIIASVLYAVFLITQAQSISDVQRELNVSYRKDSYIFTRDLFIGSRGDDVKALQQFLNSHGAQISVSGPGSRDNETMYFGAGTQAALTQWQVSNRVVPSVGYFGSKSRAVVAMMAESTVSSSLPLLAPVLIPSLLIVNQNSQQETLEFPIRLRIPRIDVDAAVDLMGITADGIMEAPIGPKNVGWFKFGPRPGDIGSAVFDGHFGRWKTGEGSVFDGLNKLREGDKLYVEDGNGATTIFVVRESRRYDPKADASGIFISNDGKSHLNLITCEGVWNSVSKTYSERLVVFADKE